MVLVTLVTAKRCASGASRQLRRGAKQRVRCSSSLTSRARSEIIKDQLTRLIGALSEVHCCLVPGPIFGHILNKHELVTRYIPPSKNRKGAICKIAGGN
jgi:hypothetical protein